MLLQFVLFIIFAIQPAVAGEGAVSLSCKALNAMFTRPRARVEVGNLIIDQSGEITWKGRPVHLRGYLKEDGTLKKNERLRQIVIALAENTEFALKNPDTGPVSTADLFEKVYASSLLADPNFDRTETTLRNHILSVQRSFLEVDPRFEALKNVHGVGYSWYEPDERLVRQFGSLEITPLVGMVAWRGNPISLEKGQYRVLRALLAKEGEVVPLVQLRDTFAGSRYRSEAEINKITPIRHVISKIKSAFKRSDKTFRQIKSVYGRGYLWQKE